MRRFVRWFGVACDSAVDAVMDMVLLLTLLLCVLVFAGCKSYRPASAPSDQQAAPMVITPQQVQLLGKAVDADVQVLASALESNPESGSVIYVDHNGYIYDAAGNVVYDKGDPPQPLRVRTKIIAKLNSLQNFATLSGVKKVEYEVGGRSYLASLPEGLKHIDTCPVPLVLRIEGADAVGVKSPVADQRDAAGRERTAIYAGMSALATAEGAAWATKVNAMADGMVKVTVASGREILGRVLGLTPLETAIEGVSTAVRAKIVQDSGKTTTVVAEGDAAAALTKEASAAVPPSP